MTEDEWSGRMTTLHGRIEEGVLANLLQYLSLSQASGCLLLRHPQSRQGYVYFEHGRIVFIEAKPSYDLAALAALLRWRDGQFSFRPGVRSPRITLERSTEMLLLEATHMADEVHERREEGPRVDADTVLSALAEGPVARAHLGNAAARHGHPEPAVGETEPMGRASDGLTEPTTRHRERTAQGERTDPGRSDPPVNRERGSRTARNGRSSRSSVRARAYAVMLPEVRTSSSDAAGAASTDEPATERHGDAGPDQSLAHEATAPAHGLAPQTTMPRSRSAIASDAPSETVALSLSALLLYRKLDGLKSLREHAVELDREPEEMVRAGRELLAARLADYVTLVVADPRFVMELAREAVDLLGPVGEIVVEDALYDLGLSGETLPIGSVDELVQELSGAFKNAFTRADFLRRVTELRRLFALEPAGPGRTR